MKGTEGREEPGSTLHEDVLALATSVRAWVEWQSDCGAEALPTALAEGEALRAIEAGRAARARPRPAAPPPPARAERPAPPAFAPPTHVAAPQAAPVAAPPAAAPARPVERAPAVTGEERRARLAVIAERVAGCTQCGLHATRTKTVFARGNPDAELVFVGEGPGADEDAQGLPFVGKAGQLLDKMITAMGLGQDEIYIANIVKCRPPGNRVPEPQEMATCIPYLHEQLDLVKPKVIVALGGTAVKGLIPGAEGITKIRGTWKVYRGAIPVMPTFHPSYVLRTPTKEVRGMVWSDLQQVLKELGRPVPARSG